MRIAFFGTPAPAVPALEVLIADPDCDIAAVVTNPDRPSGRGHKLAPPPVKAAARDAGLEIWQPQRPREILDQLREADVDACAVVAYGALLPPDVLDAGGRGFVNLHFSLLPAWRGAAPVQHSILHGDTRTGVTCFVLEAGMDTGPVLAAAETGIGEHETAGELIARLAVLGAPLLRDAVRGLIEGTMTPVDQDHGRATYAPKVTPDDARIHWQSSAAAVSRMVRAFNPVPGAWTTLRGERLKIHRARVVDGEPAPAGQVVVLADDGPVVGCGEGSVVLLEVQPAGKGRMSAGDFVNGYRPLDQVLE